MICELCDREIEKGSETKHHLIPKMIKSKDRRVCVLHELCHKQIHILYNEKIISKHFNTMHKLKNDLQIQRFIKWVRKRQSGFKVKMRISNTKR